MTRLDGDKSRETVTRIIEHIRSGETKWFPVFADEYIKEYASQEDYEYWMEEKAKYLGTI